MRAFAILVVLGVLALLSTMTQAKIKFGSITKNPVPVRPPVRCMAAIPECGYFGQVWRTCERDPNDPFCKKWAPNWTARSKLLSDEQHPTEFKTNRVGPKRSLVLRNLCLHAPEDFRCKRLFQRLY